MSNTGLKIDENIKSKKGRITVSVICGVVAGLINGLFGGGGGMIVVPMLNYFLKYPTKNAHATAILIILPLTIVSAIFYAVLGHADISLLPVAGGVIIGGVVGSFLLKNLSSKIVTAIFSVLMAAAGVKMLFF